MKYLAVILSFLIVILSVLPCTDGHTCDAKEGIPVAADHDHSQDEKDHCTPFCVCACCGLSYSVESLPIFEQVNHIPNTVYTFHYNQLYSFSFLKSVWHPPAA